MKELNKKENTKISGGYLLEGCAVALAITALGTFTAALFSFCVGGDNAFMQLRAKKQSRGQHIKHLDSGTDAELAAIAHYNKYGGGNFDTLTK